MWIVLKVNKQNTQRNEPQEAHNCLKYYTLIYVDIFMSVLLIKKYILSLLLIIFHVMVMFIFYMKNPML